MNDIVWYIFGGMFGKHIDYSSHGALIDWQEDPSHPASDLTTRGISKHLKEISCFFQNTLEM